MSKTTTADCKLFLSASFPDLPAKGWSRVRKFKDDTGCDVREFVHPQNSQSVFLLDQAGKLVLADASQITNRPTPKSAADYIYTVASLEDYELEPEPIDAASGNQGHLVLVTKLSHWNAYHYRNDEYDPTPAKYMPDDWLADDLNGCGEWWIECDLSEKQLIDTLEGVGFQSSVEYDTFCKGRSAKTAAYVAQQSHDGLTQQLTPEIDQAQPPTKILKI